MDVDGSGLKRLAAVGREPVWSPDARRIAFVGERSYLTVMNADGSEQRRLAPAASHPAWSPDGTRIVYGAGGDLYLWLVREERSEPLTRTRRNEDNPRWSPGGALISFTRGFDYYVMRADGSGQRRVARAQRDVPSLSPPDPAAWSPNGKWLALAARTPVGAPVGLTADTIHIVHPDGRGLRRVAPLSHSSQGEPSWSPDGRRIAFVWSPACPGLERWGIAAVQLGRARVRWVTQSCFVYGTAGRDTLEGTADSEILYGFQGDDMVMGRAGEDVLQGGRGDDRLDGGRTYDDICDEWCDVLRGGHGDDRLLAHDTPSYLDGGLGRDRLSGGSRWDFIDPGRGSDVVRAGRADDVVHARDGSMDRIACGGGRDAVAADPLDYVAADCEYVRRR
ncbi:MAG TPA: hypothetical protein VFM81_00840 [Actinomycetota bacterium]|nr:hypothetical protein [Actinomycetota bacterium]